METQIKKIEDYINHLSLKATFSLTELIKTKKYKKKELLLSEGAICKNLILIETGVARKYLIHNDKEITNEFFFKDDIAGAFTSCAYQLPSTEYIQAITDMKVALIDYPKFRKLGFEYPELKELDLMITEYYTAVLEDRLRQFYTLSAQERYELLLKRNPAVVLTFQLTHIASYLGITIETLSRIRAK
jgi:CRP-like cAMP-binding protein